MASSFSRTLLGVPVFGLASQYGVVLRNNDGLQR